ncbi:hypothetical protein ACFY0B_14765 [Streptomyces sp. NPDC001797]|uniref:hypothetical protein n=1 Tax=unclassified Streptomyces TaxID=2593676 RepID=UPI0036A33EE3
MTTLTNAGIDTWATSALHDDDYSAAYQPGAAGTWYSVLHEFDAAGRHLDSRIRAAGAVTDGPAKAPMVEAAPVL